MLIHCKKVKKNSCTLSKVRRLGLNGNRMLPDDGHREDVESIVGALEVLAGPGGAAQGEIGDLMPKVEGRAEFLREESAAAGTSAGGTTMFSRCNSVMPTSSVRPA